MVVQKMKGLNLTKALGGKYGGCIALIFDAEGNELGETIVNNIYNSNMHINLENLPKVLSIGSACKLLILTDPQPCEFSGKVVNDGDANIVAIFQGRERARRKEVRYKTNAAAQIDCLISEGKEYPLLEPIDVTLKNLSRTGVRFSAPYNTLMQGDIIKLILSLTNSMESLIVEVVNLMNLDTTKSEYGCRFLTSESKEG